ncbi:peptidylprolyl isomerase [uncultured Phenylobacterium sp.]|uniref:peptidylprolyl isomerase n=1 Tax=uncultured Phenylobacterium sp. TaxID=349273 RepID=UPI0025F4B850|nr:peptidylprolyl isomerase [uncultured Phenylobacterium sp.]
MAVAALAAAIGVRGQGGAPAPVLVVVNASAPNQFGAYLPEILRAEGINTFAVVQLSARDAPTLAAATVVVARSDAQEGFVGTTPFQAVSPGERAMATDGRLRGWGAYCPGVVGMGRQADPGSANSEIFFMRAPARRLDHEYTVVGRVVAGLEAIQALAVGEPPGSPDRMVRVRVAADLPASERPAIEVLDERGPTFQSKVAALKRSKGAAFSICDVEVTTRIP